MVFALDILDGENGSCLLVHDGTETGLAFDDDVGNTHLAAESGEEDDELNGVNVVADDDEGSLLGLNESDDVVETVLDVEGLLGILLLVGGGGSSSSLETGLLLLFALRAVLVQELEELSSSVLVEGVGELSNGRGDLEALTEDDLLALKADILRPLDKASQVGLGTDVLPNAEVLGGSLEERILLGLGRLAGTERSSSGLLSRSGLGFGRLVIETKLARSFSTRNNDAPRSSSVNHAKNCMTNPA